MRNLTIYLLTLCWIYVSVAAERRMKEKSADEADNPYDADFDDFPMSDIEKLFLNGTLPESDVDSALFFTDRFIRWWMCLNIERKFPGSPSCECQYLPDSYFFGYECAYSNRCDDNGEFGTTCTTPFYQVSMILEDGNNRASSAYLCADENKVFPEGAGGESFEPDELCVTTAMCPLDDRRVCACIADYAQEACSSCEPCNDGLGVQVECGGISTGCTGVELVTKTRFFGGGRINSIFSPSFIQMNEAT